MKRILVCSILSFISFSFVIAQNKPSPEAEELFNTMMSQINRRHVNWVKTSATTLNQKNMTDADAQKMASTYGTKNKLGNADIEALAFLVLMQASKSAQEDLKAIMAQVKSINKQKQDLRNLVTSMQRQNSATIIQVDSFKLLTTKTTLIQKRQDPDTIKMVRSAKVIKQPTKVELDKMIDKLKNDLDSMSELGEEMQLRMQMIMDRMTKAESAISNIMKKFSDTANSIIQNLK